MIYSWIYVIVNAFSTLLRQITGDFMSPPALLLFSCLVGVIYFHLVNFAKLKSVYKQCWQFKYEWLSLSMLVAIIWLSAMYSPVLVGASLYAFLFFSTNGICGTISLLMRRNESFINRFIALTGLIATTAIVVAMNLSHYSTHNFAGMLMAIAGGMCGYLYARKSAYLMSTTSLTPSQILAVRFYPTILICLFLIPSHIGSLLNTSNMMLILMTSVFVLIIPLYLMQKGIEKSGPALNAVITSFVPLCAALLEEAYYHHINQNLFIAALLYSLFTCLPYLPQMLKNQRGHEPR